MEAITFIGKQGSLWSVWQSLDRALPPFPFSCVQPWPGTALWLGLGTDHRSPGTGTHSPGAAELMQNSSAKLINSNNSPLTQENPHHRWWALHPTTCCSESVPVTLLILIFVRSLGQHYLEQNSLKLKTKQDLKSEKTSCVICLQPGDLNSLKNPLESRDPCPGITLWHCFGTISLLVILPNSSCRWVHAG